MRPARAIADRLHIVMPVEEDRRPRVAANVLVRRRGVEPRVSARLGGRGRPPPQLLLRDALGVHGRMRVLRFENLYVLEAMLAQQLGGRFG